MPRALSVREQNFAEYFVELGTARAAAIKLGVKPSSAAQVGHRMRRRLRVQAEIARQMVATEARAELMMKRASAYVRKHGSIPGFTEADPNAGAALEAAITDPRVVRACAAQLGMVRRRVPVAITRDGEIGIVVMELYEPNPREVVRIASLISKGVRKSIDERFTRRDEIVETIPVQNNSTGSNLRRAPRAAGFTPEVQAQAYKNGRAGSGR